MNGKQTRDCLLELLGTFGVVFFAAGIVCINQLATPSNQEPELSAMTSYQPGLLGMTLVYGLVYAVLVAVTMPRSGGGLNPAVSLMLWVFNRLDTRKAGWLIASQLAGAFLAGLCIRMTFAREVLQEANLGTPHLNLLAYPLLQRLTLFTGTMLELVLTFFLVLGIFGAPREGPWSALLAGVVLTAGGMVMFPLTGAAANPARWFGPCCWESMSLGRSQSGPWIDAVVYVAGPILGSLLAGLVCFRLLPPIDAASVASKN